MYCRYCGTKNAEDAIFCRQCGKRIGGEDTQAQQPAGSVPGGQEQTGGPGAAQESGEWTSGGQERNGQSAGQGTAGGNSGAGQSAGLLETIKRLRENEKLIKTLDAIVTGILILGVVLIGINIYQEKAGEKREQERQEYIAELRTWLDDTEQTCALYAMDSGQAGEYNRQLSDLKDEMESGEGIKDLEKKKEELEEFVQSLAADNLRQIDEYKARLEASDVSMAMPFDLEAIDSYRAEVESLTAQGYYGQALAKLGEWENLVAVINVPLDTYQVDIRQYDISDYPVIKVYLDVTDQNGAFVDHLSSSAFFVNEGRSIDGEFRRQEIINATKLDENEGISISLVADVSGSMYQDMAQAQQAMYNFTNTVQFDKGDEIELTEFSEYAYVCKSFTNNAQEVVQAINGLSANGSTRLYDTLISEIERIQSRGNAKCIIGFTDGLDNISVYSAQDVVNSAVAYNIPVFLIGIGSGCDASTLRYIAESTGGMYENINDISSLENIYNSIYRQQKEVYLLEYHVMDAENFDGTCYSNIYIRTQDGNGGYVENFAFQPIEFFDLMYNKFLIAGIDCQTRGERNLLDSGLIVTSGEAYALKEGIAHQAQASIDTGGVGSRDSSIFEVLVYYDVLNVYKDGDGYILYGLSNYNISKRRSYSAIKNDLEKEKIASWYGEISNPDQEFWIEENISNYEKLTLVKDTDGRWKFFTRVYEREDGGKAISVNTVYNVQWQ